MQADGLCLLLEALQFVNRIDHADTMPNRPIPDVRPYS